MYYVCTDNPCRRMQNLAHDVTLFSSIIDKMIYFMVKLSIVIAIGMWHLIMLTIHRQLTSSHGLVGVVAKMNPSFYGPLRTVSVASPDTTTSWQHRRERQTRKEGKREENNAIHPCRERMIRTYSVSSSMRKED